jgi:predicted ATP-grasp superfamily ATP-dependent carboligase
MFGPNAIHGLGIARNLGKNGVKVFCVSEEPNVIAHSKYCQKFYAIPNIETGKGVLKNFLSNLKKELNHPAVIFPCSDLFCISLSQIKEEPNSVLNGQYTVFGSRETVETLVNKRKFYQSLEENRIPHPITFFPKSYGDVKEVSEKIEYPVYIKPAVSQLFTRFHKKGFVVNSSEELLNIWELVSKYGIEVMVQEIIQGPATNLFGICGYFNKVGEPCAFFAYRRLREYPHMFGTNTLIESILICNVLPLKEITEKYLKRLRYHGIFEAEFKKDSRDDSFKLLEINARSWVQNSFPAKCGINIVLMAYLDAIGKKIDYSENYKTGVRWLFLVNDMISSFEMLHKKELSIPEWFSSFKNVRDFAYFSADDPLPWIMSFLYISRGYAQTLHTRALTRLWEVVFGKRGVKN